MTTSIAIAALLVSLASLGVAVRAARAADRSSGAANRSAAAAEASDRRAREPRLSITVLDPTPTGDRVIYRLRNDGPQDLDAVTVFRPRPPDRITYPPAVTGVTDWVDDEIGLGALALTEEVSFTLCCGSSTKLPEFRVRIECRAGVDHWTMNEVLPSPRGNQGPRMRVRNDVA